MGARRPAAVLGALAVVVVAVACGGGGRERSTPVRGNEVVVASFDFPESRLLAEIYAVALERAGVPVRRELGLGPRELVEPAVAEGLVDVVPEYLGSALAAIAPATGADPHDPAAVRRALAAATAGWRVTPLAPSPAQDQNGVVVSAATASRLGLRKVSDLSPVASTLALAAPPECPGRRYCGQGLATTYGVRFGRFVGLGAEADRVRALADGVADVAVVFTTDPALAGDGLVVLDDDRRLQPAENIVPLVSSRALDRYGTGLTATLDAVSAALTTDGLRFLNWRVASGGSERAEAGGWLDRHGLPASSHR